MFTSRAKKYGIVAAVAGVVALVLSGSSVYAVKPPEVTTAGGHPATESMPWVASLHTDQTGFRCGATLSHRSS